MQQTDSSFQDSVQVELEKQENLGVNLLFLYAHVIMFLLKNK